MKKQFLNLLTLVGIMLVCGASSAWGQTKVSFDLKTFTPAHPLIFNDETASVQLQFNKTSDISPDNKDPENLRGLRWQSNIDFTITVPEGHHVTSLVLTSNKNGNLDTKKAMSMDIVVNTANADKTKGEKIENWKKLTSRENSYTWNNPNAILNNPINFSFTKDTGGGDIYISKVEITYEANPTACYAPDVKVGNFNFEKHAYPIIITTVKSDQTLMVSLDGAAAVEMTSPATVYPKTKASAYTTADGLDNSETVEATLPASTFDSSKPYVAWVYNPTYTSIKDGFADDKILKGLQENYNVALIAYDDATAPSEDLNSADLIVSTEAMAGGKTLSNGMKNFVGVTPMINLKMFNYTIKDNRWSWGVPANPKPVTIGITPNTTAYKVLKGVTYEADGSISFYTESATTGNNVQTADITSGPKGNVNMGKANNGETAMHCADKFFGLGLSSDHWQTYSDNAVTVVKNAAAMLLAGEPLDAIDPIALNFEDLDLYSLYLDYAAAIPANLTAYWGKLNADAGVLTLNKIEGGVIPANTGVVVKSASTGEYAFEAAADVEAIAENSLKGVTKATTAAELETANPDMAILTLGLLNGEIGFRKPAGGSIEANKVYLPVPTASAAKGVRIAFGGDVTGISDINATTAEGDGNIYNLAGQRVAKGTKGLLIKNGKKYVNK